MEEDNERVHCWSDEADIYCHISPPFAQVSLTKLEQMRDGGNLLMAEKSERDLLIESEIVKSKSKLKELQTKVLQIWVDMRTTRTKLKRLENCLPKEAIDE